MHSNRKNESLKIINDMVKKNKFLKHKEAYNENYELYLTELETLNSTCLYDIAERDKIPRDHILIRIQSNIVLEKLPGEDSE